MKTPMRHSPARVMARLMIVIEEATDQTWWQTNTVDPANDHDWPSYYGKEPAAPDRVVTCYETTPQEDHKDFRGYVSQHYGITVRVRGRTEDEARYKAETIRCKLNEVVYDQNITIDGVQYLVQSVPQATLIPVGTENPESSRWVVNLNCLAVILTYPL